MDTDAEQQLLAAADGALGPAECALLGDLAAFVAHRLDAAAEVRVQVGALLGSGATVQALQLQLHTFLRECWDALDGLGRQMNLCLWDTFPDAGLEAPQRMTRQCTFYTVRRVLHADPTAAAHPLSELLWSETKANPHPAYGRLSFLYNLGLFVPVPLPEGDCLPGSADVPERLRGLIRPADEQRCGIEEGLDEILEWLRDFVGRCYGQMASALAERARKQN